MIPLLIFVAAQIQVVVTHQPVVSFQAVYGTRLPSVGLYQVRACNDTAGQSISLSGSKILTLASKHVTVIDQQLIPAARTRARQRTKKWKAARIAMWLAWGGALLTTGGTSAMVAASPGIALAIPIAGMFSDRLQTELAADEAAAQAVVLISEADRWTLQGGECRAGLVWARWARNQPEIFQELVTIP